MLISQNRQKVFSNNLFDTMETYYKTLSQVPLGVLGKCANKKELLSELEKTAPWYLRFTDDILRNAFNLETLEKKPVDRVTDKDLCKLSPTEMQEFLKKHKKDLKKYRIVVSDLGKIPMESGTMIVSEPLDAHFEGHRYDGPPKEKMAWEEYVRPIKNVKPGTWNTYGIEYRKVSKGNMADPDWGILMIHSDYNPDLDLEDLSWGGHMSAGHSFQSVIDKKYYGKRELLPPQMIKNYGRKLIEIRNMKHENFKHPGGWNPKITKEKHYMGTMYHPDSMKFKIQNKKKEQIPYIEGVKSTDSMKKRYEKLYKEGKLFPNNAESYKEYADNNWADILYSGAMDVITRNSPFFKWDKGILINAGERRARFYDVGKNKEGEVVAIINYGFWTRPPTFIDIDFEY